MTAPNIPVLWQDPGISYPLRRKWHVCAGLSRGPLPEPFLLHASPKKAACVPEKMVTGHRVPLRRLHPSLTRLPTAAGPRHRPAAGTATEPLRAGAPRDDTWWSKVGSRRAQSVEKAIRFSYTHTLSIPCLEG